MILRAQPFTLRKSTVSLEATLDVFLHGGQAYSPQAVPFPTRVNPLTGILQRDLLSRNKYRIITCFP